MLASDVDAELERARARRQRGGLVRAVANVLPLLDGALATKQAHLDGAGLVSGDVPKLVANLQRDRDRLADEAYLWLQRDSNW